MSQSVSAGCHRLGLAGRAEVRAACANPCFDDRAATRRAGLVFASVDGRKAVDWMRFPLDDLGAALGNTLLECPLDGFVKPRHLLIVQCVGWIRRVQFGAMQR